MNFSTSSTVMARPRGIRSIHQARGDHRLWLECVKRLQALERDRYAIRERVGYFDAYRLAPPGSAAGTGEETRAWGGSAADHGG